MAESAAKPSSDDEVEDLSSSCETSEDEHIGRSDSGEFLLGGKMQCAGLSSLTVFNYRLHPLLQANSPRAMSVASDKMVQLGSSTSSEPRRIGKDPVEISSK